MYSADCNMSNLIQLSKKFVMLSEQMYKDGEITEQQLEMLTEKKCKFLRWVENEKVVLQKL